MESVLVFSNFTVPWQPLSRRWFSIAFFRERDKERSHALGRRFWTFFPVLVLQVKHWWGSFECPHVLQFQWRRTWSEDGSRQTRRDLSLMRLRLVLGGRHQLRWYWPLKRLKRLRCRLNIQSVRGAEHESNRSHDGRWDSLIDWWCDKKEQIVRHKLDWRKPNRAQKLKH